MLVVVSPAKRLDWSATPGFELTDPEFRADAEHLASVARKLSKPKLQKLMGISADLARLNQQRFRDFSETPDAEALRPAVLAFAGDTYLGLDARSLDAEEMAWAQDHLRILSGLYGLLRPLDAIQPYRLEMGSRLKTGRTPTLYAYWGARLADALRRQAEETGSACLAACASVEYFSAVDRAALGLPVIEPVFLEEKQGEARIVSFFAKKARGAMARFIVQNRLKDRESLKDFDLGGYRFQPDRSDENRFVFLRRADIEAAA